MKPDDWKRVNKMEDVWETDTSEQQARRIPDGPIDAVYRMMMVILIVFMIRTIVTASICHYVFNTTMPFLLESLRGEEYDRNTFKRLPFSCSVLLVVMILVLFPTK